MAVALCLALLVSGTAFAWEGDLDPDLVIKGGPFDADPSSNRDMVYGVLASEDHITVKLIASGDQYWELKSPDTIPYDFVFTSSPDFTASADFIFVRAGMSARSLAFVLSNDTLYSMDLAFRRNTTNFIPVNVNDGRWMWVRDVDSFNEGVLPESSLDVAFEWRNACCELGCNQIVTERVLVTATSPDVASRDFVDFVVYVPCGNIHKMWQVIPRSQYVHYLDMVLYSNDVSGNVAIDLGPFVVEGRGDGTTRPWDADWLAERIWNKGSAYARALTASGRFDWVPILENDWFASEDRQPGTQRGAANLAYKYRTILTPPQPQGYEYYGGLYRYLDLQDENRSRDAGVWATDWKRYYTYPGEYSAFADPRSLDLDPGMAMYFGYPLASEDALKALDMHIEFVQADGTADLGLCQSLDIETRIWNDGTCLSPVGFECATVTPLNVDRTTKTEVAGFLGVSSSDIDWFETVDGVCNCCEPWIAVNCQPTLPKDTCTVNSTLCVTTSFDVNYVAQCAADDPVVLPVRIDFDLNDSLVCDVATRSAISSFLGRLPQQHKGPIDAFFDNGTSNLTIGVYGYDRKWYNLVDRAVESFSEAERTARPWLGVKNFFRVWPENAPSQTVVETWNNHEPVKISFYAVLAYGEAPAGQEPVQAKDGYFLIYTGTYQTTYRSATYNHLLGRAAIMTAFTECGTTPTPTPTEFVTFEGFTNDEWTVVPLSDDEQNAAKAKLPDGFLVGSQIYANTVNGAIESSDVDMIVTADAETAAVVKNVSGDWVLQTETTASDFSLAAQKRFSFEDGGEYDQDGAVNGSITLSAFVCTEGTPTSTPTPGGDDGSSGCNTGFAPLALLLLAPLAVLLKK